MAAVSLSPAPISSFPSTMSSRRAPLASNHNAANSPMRTRPSASFGSVIDKHVQKQKRAHASVQRDEPYSQPPPQKKQLLNDGSKEAVRFPPPIRQVKIPRKDLDRPHKEDKPSQSAASKAAQQEEEATRMRRWKEATRANFPDYVFYFESAPDDKRAKFVKQIVQLGGREEKFFSKDITHVITTRSVPTDRSRTQSETVPVPAQTQREQRDISRTIDPSLLSRDLNTKDVRRRLLESGRKRVTAPMAEDNPVNKPTAARNTDILVRAHEMKKKIWHHNKLQRVLQVMFDPDPLGIKGNVPATEQTAYNLGQLLDKERANGPSDRDPTVSTKELVYFKGPYLYIYDIEEKQKPIMVREYAKVSKKDEGDWPQFRATGNGRCPFVEEDPVDRERRAEKEAREKERQVRRERELAKGPPKLEAPAAPLGRPIGRPTVAKRTQDEMQDSHARASVPARASEFFDLTKASNPPSLENAFTSRAKGARLFGGEPVASGIQASNITSAIRSQMISSATGILGAKAGTSRELHGLQRKVLHKGSLTSANPTSQDGSRRLADMSLDTNTYQRSASLGVGSRKLGQIEEDNVRDHKRTVSVPAAAPVKAKKRELKPGYCENCQDKFNDFDEHILTKKHRKFAEDPVNWASLDKLLSQLGRKPRYCSEDDEASVGSAGH